MKKNMKELRVGNKNEKRKWHFILKYAAIYAVCAAIMNLFVDGELKIDSNDLTISIIKNIIGILSVSLFFFPIGIVLMLLFWRSNDKKRYTKKLHF
ncbi:hypothetical protein [Cytobacillus sp. IB215665]|uniref:hypothetical protein n=1 Tax=Cytobacillus sp. IB215665 TaxID=3097357 RepID=UPI002A16F09C|nr:hypothetical protein [Cytobacillus sp. IB215665]MDX8365582.1 hypothetical protein [Cytobacillus sp. IB215665]